MSKKTTLLFGIHMHQPVDNFEWVIEHAVNVCYAPFFDIMSQYPSFKFSVHCSGWLMEQIEKSYPKLFNQIVTLAHNGSIEFFSAGYYEPILSAIPSTDRVRQIQLLNDSIKLSFHQIPQGLWLTERVWESSLIPDLNRCGIKYTVMDDYHFQCAGFNEEVLDGYYMSEENGETLALFPMNKKLRYAIPFMNVEQAIKVVKSFNREKDSAAIIFDDAEKFGMWPGTYDWVYNKGWLVKFIHAVLSDDHIQTMHFSEYYNKIGARGITYLPNVSYYEMGEWSLRADDALKLEAFKDEIGQKRYDEEGVKFLKGGIWKNFLVKYEESNRIHKRMLELSAARTLVNHPDFDTALYKLQMNDPLWHGVFGGLYLPNLRDNIYHYLIECENLRYDDQLVILEDNNELDGHPKIKMVSGKYLFRFDGGYGGQLVEFDSRERCFNWQNTLMRREEAYHHKIFEDRSLLEDSTPKDGIDTIHHALVPIDQSLRNMLIYDWHLKNSFIDHIGNNDFCYDNFRYCDFKEYGDFANQPFEASHNERGATFIREGGLYFPQKAYARLEKSFYPTHNGFDFMIHFKTEAEGYFNYILEHNFHFADYDAIMINDRKITGERKFYKVNKLNIDDGYLKKKITITLDQPCDIIYFPIETLSQSEKGFDLTVQGLCFAMSMRFNGELTLNGTLEVDNV